MVIELLLSKGERHEIWEHGCRLVLHGWFHAVIPEGGRELSVRTSAEQLTRDGAPEVPGATHKSQVKFGQTGQRTNRSENADEDQEFRCDTKRLGVVPYLLGRDETEGGFCLRALGTGT